MDTGKLGARIKYVREKRGMEPKDLSNATGIPYSTLKGLEEGDQKSSTKLHLLVAALRTNSRYLLTGKGKWDEAESAVSPVEDEIQAIRHVLAAIVATMVTHRPAEAADLTRALRDNPPGDPRLALALLSVLDPSRGKR